VPPSPEHWRKLERLYLSAPTNDYYRPTVRIAEGAAEISLAVRREFFHAAHAVHGSVYFKLLDDAAFFAANSVVTDVFVLTSSLTIHLLRPVTEGLLTAKGRLIHPGPRQLLAESELFDSEGRMVGQGTGTFVRSRIALGPEIGYV
jgi:uncharacterized protein (TIGR00369 family)